MDSPEGETKDESPPRVSCLRLSVLLVFSLIAVVSFPLFLGFASVFAASKSISNPIAVPSHCRIVSTNCCRLFCMMDNRIVYFQKYTSTNNSVYEPKHRIFGVDLKSTEVCELGLLNYKAKHVLYPSERKKFRCRHDYYWASVFKVEYRDHSGQIQVALAEAPKEALPLHCRPSFGVAWLTKEKFKVNQTYDCWYTFGLPKVNINHESLFSCQAKDPSTVEMLKRYFILSKRIFESWYFKRRRRAWYWKWEAIAGVLTGFSTSLISISLFRIIQFAKSSLIGSLKLPRRASFAPRLRRACLFIAYFSFMGFLAIQYAKRIGLQEILYR